MAKKTNITKKKPKTKKPVRKSAPAKAETGSRLRRLNKRTARKQARFEARSKVLPSAFRVLKDSLKHLYRHKKLFIGILAIFMVLNLLFARGLSSIFPLASFEQQLADSTSGTLTGIGKGAALFGLLLGSGASAESDAGTVYQSIFIVLGSLAVIWALRQTYVAGAKLKIKEAYYRSTQPLVPFIIVLIVLALQSIPLLISASLYASVQAGGLAVSGVEQFLWLVILVLGSSITLYFACGTLLALYIVTLPGTKPLAALRAAKGLVRHRRRIVIRKMLFFPLMVLIFLGAVLIPLIIFIAPAAEVLFVVFSVLILGAFHSYYYTLYRSML